MLRDEKNHWRLPWKKKHDCSCFSTLILNPTTWKLLKNRSPKAFAQELWKIRQFFSFAVSKQYLSKHRYPDGQIPRHKGWKMPCMADIHLRINGFSVPALESLSESVGWLKRSFNISSVLIDLTTSKAHKHASTVWEPGANKTSWIIQNKSWEYTPRCSPVTNLI